VLAFSVSCGKLKQFEKRLPELRPGWALIRLRLAGICNTDVEILCGYHAFRGTPGHEFVGEVADVRGVPGPLKKKWLGRRVVGEINVSCSAYGFRPLCDFCKRGLKTHCARRTVLGIFAHDGAFAEYLALPLENLHAVPDSVTDDQAVFVEPLAAACEILEQVDVKQFRSAAVLGDGKLAQLIALVLRTAVPHVVMYGKHEKKLALARRVGIQTKKVRGDGTDLKRIKESYGLLVEATGSPSGFALAQHMTEPRGTLVLKSTFHGAAPIETWPIVVKEITVVGSRCGPFSKALALLRSGKIDPRLLITCSFSLNEATEAIRFAQEPGVMKVLLKAWESRHVQNPTKRALETIDTGRDAGGAKAVVNVHDRNIRSARIKHAEQRRNAAKARAVTNAGRHRNDRRRNQPAHDARQRAFHSSHTNNHARLRQLFAMFEQSVNARDANVVQMLHAIPHNARSQQSLFRNGNVTRSRRDHHNSSLPGDLLGPLGSDHAGQLVKFRGPRRFTACALDGRKCLRVRSSD
jgi:alcohol dehydrogenase